MTDNVTALLSSQQESMLLAYGEVMGELAGRGLRHVSRNDQGGFLAYGYPFPGNERVYECGFGATAPDAVRDYLAKAAARRAQPVQLETAKETLDAAHDKLGALDIDEDVRNKVRGMLSELPVKK